ncbi:Hypp450 [Branchiostoma lanceolatum]|uniref:Hypp450 protein n=1 Tax=Branchiostoma lanceolatum TaxID=7740 RepID=A0A8J9YNU3_BRALA|nr:Hypp450 [Branchiostoma lanceolatum]
MGCTISKRTSSIHLLKRAEIISHHATPTITVMEDDDGDLPISAIEEIQRMNLARRRSRRRSSIAPGVAAIVEEQDEGSASDHAFGGKGLVAGPFASPRGSISLDPNTPLLLGPTAPELLRLKGAVELPKLSEDSLDQDENW